jgi:hypothetical protein
MKCFIQVEISNPKFNLLLKYLSFEILNLTHYLFPAEGFLFFKSSHIYFIDVIILGEIN